MPFRLLILVATTFCTIGCQGTSQPTSDLTDGAVADSTAPDSSLSEPNTRTCSPGMTFFDGGVGRDGIPALTNPGLDSPDKATFLTPSHRVLGLVVDGVARAYPLPVLWWHEIINDTMAGTPVLVSYCPLTGSGIAFDPRMDGETRNFGVSGLIHENNLVMFDRERESLWNQMLLGSQCGPDRGQPLRRLPLIETTWSQWRSLYPGTSVVTNNAGSKRVYGSYPYGDYDRLDNAVTLYPSSEYGGERPPKELVLGIQGARKSVAYPFGALAKHGSVVTVNDELGGSPILVVYTRAANAAWAFDRRVDGHILTFSVADTTEASLLDDQTGSTWNIRGEAVLGPLAGSRLDPVVDSYTVFWFAWSVFHPQTRLGGL